MPGKKPIALHKLQGTFRKDRHAGSDAPTFSGGVPKPPSWLGREGRAEYKRIVAELEPAGVLQQTDFAVLCAYCEAFGEFVVASKAIEKDGATTTSARGREVASPMLKIKNQAADRVARFAAHLGLSPSTRGRVSCSPPPPPDTGKARFFQPGGVATRDRGDRPTA